MRLTDISIRNLATPPAGQKVYYDDAMPNFGCRVSQGGARSFILRYGPDRQLITIGRYPILSLKDARQVARERMAEFVLGKHRPRGIKWDDAVALYLSACAEKNRPRTVADYTRRLRLHFKFGRTQVSEITYEDIERKLAHIHAPVERDHALIVVKTFLAWCQKPPRRYFMHNPCEGMTRVKRPSRMHTLNELELAAVLRTALCATDTFSGIVAFLTLAGQRRGETASLRRSWFDTKAQTITIPASVTKNGKEHTFPYGRMISTLLEIMPDTGDLLFPASREHVRGVPTTTYNGWTKDKAAFDKKCGVKNWTLHDLRRTFATNMAELGVLPHVIERLLNHQFGGIATTSGGVLSAVARVYNRHTYLPEMRDAIQRWEARVSSISGASPISGCDSANIAA